MADIKTASASRHNEKNIPIDHVEDGDLKKGFDRDVRVQKVYNVSLTRLDSIFSIDC